jgi:hypothetical protein
METKITGLTKLNVEALREVFPAGIGLELTATTATWTQETPLEAIQRLDTAMATLPTRGYPRHSLYAVRRKLARLQAEQ